MAIATKKVLRRGTLQGIIHANGRWMAVMAGLTSGPKDPVISRIVPIDQLGAVQRRKAERWLSEKWIGGKKAS